jgi:hypothetical protein
MFGLKDCAVLARMGALAVLHVTVVGQTIPRGYEIVDITSNNGANERIPRINNRGDIVFFTNVSATEGEIFLYQKTTNSMTQLTDDDVFDGLPDIADDGSIVWTRFIGPPDRYGPTGEIFMRTPDGLIIRITDDEWHDASASINSFRRIVWKKFGPVSPCGLESMDLFTWDGSGISRLTTSGEEFGYANQGADINDLGQIVWTEYDFCDPPFPYNFTSRTMLYDGAHITELPSAGVAPQGPTINEIGWVVWQGFDPVLFRDTVELWNGSETVVLTYGANPTVNDLGHIAFNRWDMALGAWQVWLYRDGQFLRLVDEPLHNHTPSINVHSEVTWVHGSQLSNGDIRMLRRFSAGDCNCDGAIDAFDIEAFVLALLNPTGYDARYPQCDPALADLDGDGSVTAFDIEPFVATLVP